LTRPIIRYVKREHNLMIGERTAEDIKIQIGSVYPQAQTETREIRGRDFVTGLPKIIDFSSEEACLALSEPVAEIISQGEREFWSAPLLSSPPTSLTEG